MAASKDWRDELKFWSSAKLISLESAVKKNGTVGYRVEIVSGAERRVQKTRVISNPFPYTRRKWFARLNQEIVRVQREVDAEMQKPEHGEKVRKASSLFMMLRLRKYVQRFISDNPDLELEEILSALSPAEIERAWSTALVKRTMER